MTANAREFLARFDDLSPTEQREVAAEIIRRVGSRSAPTMTDDELIGAAEELFLALDHAEATDGQDISAR